MDLAEFALGALDVGVVLVLPETGEILLTNAAADRCLCAFGDCKPEPGHFPRPLWDLVEHLLMTPNGSRFTSAVPVNAPDGRRFYVRARRTSCPRGTVLLTIAAAALREVDLKRMLSARFGLSAQEIKVTFLACQGYRNKEIAEELKLVEGTVKNYLTRVFGVLAVRNRTELGAELHQLLEEQTDVHQRGT